MASASEQMLLSTNPYAMDFSDEEDYIKELRNANLENDERGAVQGLLGLFGLDAVTRKTKQLAEKKKTYNEGLAAATEEYARQIGAGGEGVTEADYKASMSPYAQLAAVAKDRLKNQASKEITPDKLLPYANAATIEALARDPSARTLANFGAKRNIGEVGGVAYDKDTLGVIKLAGMPESSLTTDTKGNTLLINPTTGLPEVLDKAPKVNVEVKNNMSSRVAGAQDEAWKTEMKRSADHLDEMRKGYSTADRMLGSIGRLEKQLPDVITGPLSGAVMMVNDLASELGSNINLKPNASSEAFASTVTNLWADWMSSLGGARGLVKEESDRLMAALPSLKTNPQSIGSIINQMKEIAMLAKQRAEAESRQLNKKLKAKSFDEFIDIGSTLDPYKPTGAPQRVEGVMDMKTLQELSRQGRVKPVQ